jgi:hypothetical protein
VFWWSSSNKNDDDGLSTKIYPMKKIVTLIALAVFFFSSATRKECMTALGGK